MAMIHIHIRNHIADWESFEKAIIVQNWLGF